MAGAAPEPLDPYGPYFDRLAKLGMAVAQDLHDRTLAAETSADAANLAKAFNQTTRGVRQTLALHARLQRERDADRRAERDGAERVAAAQALAHRQAVARRREAIRAAVAPLIWTEYEKPEEADFLTEELEAELDHACGEDDFLEGAVDAAVLKIRGRLPIREDGSVEPEALAEWLEDRREDYEPSEDPGSRRSETHPAARPAAAADTS